MKTQGLVLLGAIVLVAIIGFNLVNRQPDGDLILVFKGYSSAATNTTRLANFELHNTSSRTVWLCYSGTEFPLRGPFLERVMPPSPKMNNAPWTNIGISIVSYFEQGVKLLPGQNLSLDYLLRPGEPTLEVGIEYYVGRFKDGNDF